MHCLNKQTNKQTNKQNTATATCLYRDSIFIPNYAKGLLHWWVMSEHESTKDIEIRMMANAISGFFLEDEDTPVQLIEIFVQ